MDLAKQQADKPEEDDNDLRKKLWLRIGENDCPLYGDLQCPLYGDLRCPLYMVRTEASSAEGVPVITCLLNNKFDVIFFV